MCTFEYSGSPGGPKRLQGSCAKVVFEAQGPEKHINRKQYFPETGVDILEGVPGRRASFHD